MAKTIELPFRERLAQLPREKLLDIIHEQNPEIRKQVRRIEWVFETKLRHLNWNDGTPIEGRLLTNEELALLIDEPFERNRELTQMGLSEEDQRNLHMATDPVLWARSFLNADPRAYQIMILRHPSLKKVLRAGRRLGKTWTMAILLLHYSYTHNDGRCIVVAPMKPQAELIYQEIMKLAKKNDLVLSSVVRNVTSPQFTIEMSNGSTIRFFTSGIKCLTPDHDVLTRVGWQSIDKVQVGDEIVSWKDGQLTWAETEAAWSYDYEGDLITHSGKQLSFRTTPEHRFLARPSKILEYRMTEVTNLKNLYRIPASGAALPGESKIYTEDELELWGWWLSEGSGFIGNAARFTQKKQPGLDRIVELVRNLGYKPQVYTYGDKASEIRVLGWKPPIFSGKNCFDKFIPRELFSEYNRASLLKGLLAGDGWIRKKGWEYSSSSLQLANDVQELAVGLGWRSAIREKNIKYVPVGGGDPNRHWIVSGYPYEDVLVNSALMSREKYKGKVYCLTVPDTGVFLTRHNGIVHLTGNSGGKADVVRGQEAHIIVLDELDYMHGDDLESLYAMLQKTAEDQPDKILIGASTPTGARSHFWEWCNSSDFREFWFPSYCNPFFDKKSEEFFHNRYSEMGYRHEVEADWGEDTEGVYPRKYVDLAFTDPGWEYKPDITSARSFFVFGVDWDKYAAGTNIVVLEVCQDDYEDERFRGKTRLAYREETAKEEFSLIGSIDRIIELNKIFQPRFIYVDRGFGEVQVELLHKYGVEHPESNLRKRVIGVQFSETIEVMDPHTKQPVKKDLKPFMVDNLRQFLEKREIMFSAEDEDLYLQLISYVVARVTPTGRPIFESSGNAQDHAHDALILACLAITQNYGELMRVRLARRGIAISNEVFLPMFEADEREQDIAAEVWGSTGQAPILKKRAMSVSMGRARPSHIKRKMF